MTTHVTTTASSTLAPPWQSRPPMLARFGRAAACGAFVLAAALWSPAAHASFQVGDAGTAPARASSTWEQYMADLKPNLEAGLTGLTIDSKFWDKYNEMPVEWTGRFKACSKNKDGSVSCDVTMPAHTIKVMTGPESGTVIDTITVSLLPNEVPRWQELSAGMSIRFAAKTLATVFAVPAKEKGGSPFVGIVLTEGRLVQAK